MRGFAGLFLAIAVVFALSSLTGAALPEKDPPAPSLLRQKYASEMAVKGALLDAVYFGAREGEKNYAAKAAAGADADLQDEIEDAVFARVAAASGDIGSAGGWGITVWCGKPNFDEGGSCGNCQPIGAPLCKNVFLADALGRKVSIGNAGMVAGFGMERGADRAIAYIPSGTEVGY